MDIKESILNKSKSPTFLYENMEFDLHVFFFPYCETKKSITEERVFKSYGTWRIVSQVRSINLKKII